MLNDACQLMHFFGSGKIIDPVSFSESRRSTMERSLSKWTVSAAMVFMFCMVGGIMIGTAFGAGGQENGQCVDNKDGTVTDKNTGLMWQKATAGHMNWNGAMNYASGLSLAGHSDWRLPTKEELERIYKSPCKSMMDVGYGWYWSSSPRWNRPNEREVVHSDDGSVSSNNVINADNVLAVRSAW
jgi:hypothetical protein